MEPVELYNPKTERTYTARTPVDLNDRLAAGFKRTDEAGSDAKSEPAAEQRESTDSDDSHESESPSMFSRWTSSE